MMDFAESTRQESAVIRDLYVPVLTPYDENGAISGTALAKHCEWIMAAGATGVLLFGTTGEGPSIGITERIDAARGLVAALPEVPVVAAVTHAALPDALTCIQGYNDVPLAGVLVMPPFFFPDPDPAAITAFLTATAAASAHPVLAYHLPDLAPAVPVEVARIPGLWGIKDSSGDLEYSKAALAAGNSVMVGAENTIPEAMRLGAAGTIAGMGNLLPGELAAVCRAADNGDTATAGRQLHPVLQLRNRLLEGNPGTGWIAAMKAIATYRHGIDLGGVRTALHSTGDYLTADIRKLLDLGSA
jgi:4-hydroxy-tetrahydrodipicolinate synthase